MRTHTTVAPRDRTLVLFSQSYPFDIAMEATFLAPELPHLQAAFDRVIIVPAERNGERDEVPGGIAVDEGYARLLARHSARPELVTRGALAPHFWAELAKTPSLLTTPRAIARLAVFAGRAELTRRWALQFLSDRELSPGRCALYTFWCYDATAGLSLLKHDRPEIVLVSRAHGFDLYPDRHEPPFLPYRELTLRALDGLYPDSACGESYVARHHPWFASRCRAALMGVRDPGFITAPSDDGVLRLVSCSRLVPVKRVDLILQAIGSAARQRPQAKLEWHHFGDGPLRPELETQTTRLPANAAAHFHGYPSLEALMQFYSDHPIDAFVNASRSEGTPISIMEAVSCGIPVVATRVGGNPEIVSDENGLLVSSNPAPDELAAAFISLMDDQDSAKQKRRGSRLVWEHSYDSERNYGEFARGLRALRDARSSG